jgi:hypothetical protein
MANPEIDLKEKMSELSAHFQNFIMTHLHAYQKSLGKLIFETLSNYLFLI